MRDRANHMDDAVEVIGGGASRAHTVITCEHASNRLPPPLTWPEGDRDLVDTHWAYDIGARSLSMELVRELGTVAVVARFTRLLVDANRGTDSPELIRARLGGRGVELNRGISQEERERRIERYWRVYHDAVDRQMVRDRPESVLAVHSFTPVLDGRERRFEVGILFDRDEALAERLRRAIMGIGITTRMNEPYSGKQGLIYSAAGHAEAHGCEAVEIEVRQDRLGEPKFIRALLTAVKEGLTVGGGG